MIQRTVIAVAVAALSACQVTVVPPVTEQPGGSSRPSVSELRTACTGQAARQGLRVLQIGSFATVTGSRGREIGAAAPMRVVRSGQMTTVQCNYSFGDRQVRITPVDDREEPGRRPTTAELRAACTRSAQAQDLGVLRIGEFRTVTGSRGIEIGAASEMTVVRNSQVFDLRCNYSFGDQQVRLTET